MPQYMCSNCRKIVDMKELFSLPGVRCPYCGYRILFKVRPQVVKEIKTK
jgi:DNA-directed RNA polymerase subunit P